MHLLLPGDTNINRQSPFLWIRTVFHFIRVKQYSHSGFSKIIKEAIPSFNITLRYIDSVISLNNSNFVYFIDRIYLFKLG